MTKITKTNERDERVQISDALTSLESDIATLQASVATLEAGVNGKVPTELKGISTTVANLDVTELVGYLTSATASTSTFDTWTTILEETAAEGVLEFVNVYQVANASSLNAQARLSIDGTVVWTSGAAMWDDTADNEFGVNLIGFSKRSGTTLTSVDLGSIPFTTSFKLEFKKTENAAGTVEMGSYYKYYLT